MDLKSFALGRKTIVFDITLNPQSTDDHAATEERRVHAVEEPLPELIKAFDNLKDVFIAIMELPKDYTEGLSISKITVSRTKHGTRSISLSAKKSLSANKGMLHAMNTPLVRIEKPADGESGDQEIETKHAKLVLTAIHEATRYANGERSQKLLGLDGANLVDPESGETLFKD